MAAAAAMGVLESIATRERQIPYRPHLPGLRGPGV